MVVKLDLEKAYDRLEWDFIRKVLLYLNFPDSWMKLIMSCISSSSLSVIVNGGTAPPKASSLLVALGRGTPFPPIYSFYAWSISTCKFKKLWKENNGSLLKLQGLVQLFRTSFLRMILSFLLVRTRNRLLRSKKLLRILC